MVPDYLAAELTEEQLRGLLHAIFEAAPDAILAVDRSGEIMLANAAAVRMFGYADHELHHMPIERLMPERLRAVHERMRGEYSRAPRSRPMGNGDPLLGRRRDGTEFPVDISLGPLDRIGLAAVAVVRDATKRRQAEQRLRQGERLEAIGRLAGGVAHDFNNMLTVILGYTHALAEGLPEEEEADALLEIRRAAERSADVARQLLAFGRRQILRPEQIDLNELLSGMEPFMRRLIGEDIELTLLKEPALGTIQVDPTRLEQVVMNLVLNARDAMPTGGKLTLETDNVVLDESYAMEHPGVTPGPHVALVITDTGQGIEPATQARMFEPFFTTKELGKGTGLGLATVFGIVKQSGGHIWVYSELESGTTMKVYFPRSDRNAAAVSSKPPSIRHDERGTETILLVEDEASVRRLASTVLRARGYQVIEAASGPEALQACDADGAIHMLLTDVVLPRMSGRAIAEQVVAKRPGVKVLYMSGYTDSAIVHHGILDSDVEFLEKPLTPQALAQKVRDVLDREPR